MKIVNTDTKDSVLVLVGPEGEQDKFLSYISPEGKIFGGQHRLPGGKIKSGETFEDTLQREASEEFGIKLEGIKVLLEKPNVLGGIVYLCSARTDGNPEKRESDVGEPEWRTAIELAESNMPPNCKILLYTHLDKKGERHVGEEVFISLGKDKEFLEILQRESPKLYAEYMRKYSKG